MISHEHRCIFIHISKCAGSSIEHAFGINIADNTENNNKHLFGWNQKHKLFLQHATPQELIDYDFISENIWNEYYKFIIVRNPYSRALSDYNWLINDSGIKDSFENFMCAKGKFESVLKVKKYETYRGDHLTAQKDYFYLNDNLIDYDRVLRFENLDYDLKLLCKDLGVHSEMFNQKINTSEKKNHYSHFFNKRKRLMVYNKYRNDLEFLDYCFEDKRPLFTKFFSNL